MGIITRYRRGYEQGFTIVELLVIIIVMVVLAALVYTNYAGSGEKSRENAASNVLQNIASAMNLYVYKNNTYPPDGNHTLPNELKPYIADSGSSWPPKTPWDLPGAFYDFDAWSIAPASGGAIDTYQVGVRFCTGAGTVSCTLAQLPSANWANGFTNHSAYYWCIKGYCRPDSGVSTTYAGYCINCPNNQGIKYSGEP